MNSYRNRYIEMLHSKYRKSLLTKRECSLELGVSEATIDRMRKSGEISSRKVAGQIFFTLEMIAQLVA